MPRKPIDYSKTIIYHFVCNNPEIKNEYVGSTTDFTSRKKSHKCSCNGKKETKIYKIMNENGGWENWRMVPLEEYPCENEIQATIREQYWINELKSDMNSQRAYRSVEERKLQKREVNIKHKDQYNQARSFKYHNDSSYKNKKKIEGRNKYQKVKEVLKTKRDNMTKEERDAHNEKRRNPSSEVRKNVNEYARWYRATRNPYENILVNSFLQKILRT